MQLKDLLIFWGF